MKEKYKFLSGFYMLQFTKNTQMWSKSVWCLSSSRTLTPALPLGSHRNCRRDGYRGTRTIYPVLVQELSSSRASHRADHEAGPQKEQNIQGGRMLLRGKQHMVGLWQKDGHVTSQDVCIWTYSLTAKFLLPVMLIYFQMREKKFCFPFQKKCKYHPQLRACMIIIKRFS